MCNYYPSRMKMHGIDFLSSEHAYQWRFLKYIGQHDLTEESPTLTEKSLKFGFKSGDRKIINSVLE